MNSPCFHNIKCLQSQSVCPIVQNFAFFTSQNLLGVLKISSTKKPVLLDGFSRRKIVSSKNHKQRFITCHVGIVKKQAVLICFLIASLIWLYIESAICHTALSDQCILVKFGTFEKAYRPCLYSYSSIRRSIDRIWKIVQNCTVFFESIVEVLLFTCCRTDASCLTTNRQQSQIHSMSTFF